MSFSRWWLPTGVLLLLGIGSCAGRRADPAADLHTLPWDSLLVRARGTVVTWRMWRGDPSINAYVDRWVAPRLLSRYGVTLRAVEGQGAEMVNQLVVERQVGGRGSTDLLWINGETFGSLRQAGLLYGPWAGRLPNAAFVDSASPIVRRDFEQDPAGFESPWGTVQFALIYDSARTPSPPRSVAELGAWIDAHPGRFTHDQGFTGITLLKILMYALAGGVERFQGGFDEVRYADGRRAVFDWLSAHRRAFWRDGTVYPPDVADLHRLFANGEVDFSMSPNQNEVIAKIRQGILPPTARPLLLREGTIANTHYLAIPFNADHPAGAMVVADFLLSPEAQLEKQKSEVWADGTVLDPTKLPPEWAAQFNSQIPDPRGLSADSLRRYARPEVSPAYHARLGADWRARIRQSP